MSMTEQIYSQACILAGDLEDREKTLLELLCRSAEAGLKARLRPGITPEDCRVDFVAAASLFALASLSSVSQDAALGEVKVGDVTLKRQDPDAASRCLRSQAELIIGPYLADRFSFRGV